MRVIAPRWSLCVTLAFRWCVENVRIMDEKITAILAARVADESGREKFGRRVGEAART